VSLNDSASSQASHSSPLLQAASLRIATERGKLTERSRTRALKPPDSLLLPPRQQACQATVCTLCSNAQACFVKPRQALGSRCRHRLCRSAIQLASASLNPSRSRQHLWLPGKHLPGQKKATERLTKVDLRERDFRRSVRCTCRVAAVLQSAIEHIV